MLGVPVPDVGPEPDLYSASVLVIVLLCLGVVGVLGFLASVFTAGRRETSARAVWVPVVAPLVVMLVGVVGGALLYRHEEKQRFEELWAYWAEIDDLRPGIRDTLEEAYGITIAEDGEALPIGPGDYARLEVRLADGSDTECWFEARETYEITCGGGRNEGQPLRPIREA